MSKKNTTISLISYLNAKPLTIYFEKNKINDLNIVSDIPSNSCRKLISGQVEAGLVSSIIIAENKNLKVVNNISIASEGPVESVLLLSKKSIKNIKSIALDEESRTSNVLLQILLNKFFDIKPNYKTKKGNIETLLEQYDAVLAIGDKAFNYGIDNPSDVLWDLAMEWKHFTGLPFVFAVWGVTKESKLKSSLFVKAKEYGLNHINDIAEEFSNHNNLSHFGRKLAYKYLTENLSYNLGDKEQKSLFLFFKYAEELNLIKYSNKVDFF